VPVFHADEPDQMKFVVYCDESRHDRPETHRFMAIGGLWVPALDKPDLTRALQRLRNSVGLRGEAKWQKVSFSHLAGYQYLVDFFFEHPSLQYRVIVVDQSRVDIDRFHEGDAELGFYKFYYEMLEKWIEPANEYLVLLDFKQNRGAMRYADLKSVLQRHATKNGACVADVTIIDSREAPLGQLCDVLTGAVAASCCTDIRKGSPKQALAKHIEQRAGFSLRTSTPTPGRCKFNIFRIHLS
jgi:hypothetical protein